MRIHKIFFLIVLILIIVGCISCLPHRQHSQFCNYDAANEFKRWNKAGGRELPGLTKRRKEETKLFLKGCPHETK